MRLLTNAAYDAALAQAYSAGATETAQVFVRQIAALEVPKLTAAAHAQGRAEAFAEIELLADIETALEDRRAS